MSCPPERCDSYASGSLNTRSRQAANRVVHGRARRMQDIHDCDRSNRYLRAVAVAVFVCSILALAGAGGGASSVTAASVTPEIAYVTGPGPGVPQVWLAGANGSHSHKLGPGTQPLLSPNGRLVAANAVIGGGRALLVYSLSGALAAGFFDISRVQAVPLAWSPDSRYIAASLSGYVATATGLGPSALVIIDTTSNRATTVAHGLVEGASFAPSGPDRVVYGLTSSLSLRGTVNLHSALANGAESRQLTHDGRSLNPLWGKRGIAFDREQLRGPHASAYQIVLLRSGRSTQITRLRLSRRVEGLVPVAVSRDGTRLVVQYEGFDAWQAWTVNLTTERVHELTAPEKSATSSGISRTGRRVLVGIGGQARGSNDKVETIPFSGGTPTVLVAHGGEPSWNQ